MNIDVGGVPSRRSAPSPMDTGRDVGTLPCTLISLPVAIAGHARRHGSRTSDVAERERIREDGR
jgi:hypothetical protein